METTVLEAGEKAIQALQIELEDAKLSLEISNNEKVLVYFHGNVNDFAGTLRVTN